MKTLSFISSLIIISSCTVSLNGQKSLGDPETQVKGIVTCMFATMDVNGCNG